MQLNVFMSGLCCIYVLQLDAFTVYQILYNSCQLSVIQLKPASVRLHRTHRTVGVNDKQQLDGFTQTGTVMLPLETTVCDQQCELWCEALRIPA